MKLSNEILEKIKKESEVRFPTTFMNGHVRQDDLLFPLKRAIAVEFSSTWATRAEALKEALEKIKKLTNNHVIRVTIIEALKNYTNETTT